MNINRFNSIQYTNFKANKDTKMQETNKLTKFKESSIPKIVEHVHNRAEREVPENNKFTRVYTAFDIPDSKNEAFLDIDYDAREPIKGRCLSINVHRPNDDRIFTHYLLDGNKKEILNYLKDPNNQAKIIESVFELSQKVDEHFSSL